MSDLKRWAKIFMRIHYLRFLILAMILSVAARAANDPESISLARELFDNTVALQAEPIVDRLVIAASRQGRAPDSHLKVYREELLKVFRSEDYRTAYIQAYTDTFSQEELKSLVKLSKDPAFGIFLAKSQRITELTYPTFVRLQKDSNAVVERRIRELDAR